jgi:hypothetical protein
MSTNSESSFGILPPLNRDKLQKLVETSSTQDEKTSEYAELIKGYFTQKNANGGCEVFTCPPEIKGLTKDGALLILNNLTQATEIAGAMIFPQHNKIMLQFKHDKYSNYIIDYSENGRGFRTMDMLRLDIDDGFSYDLFAAPSDKEVVDELKILFQAWKNNDYQGRLIPAHLSGFVYDALANSNNNSTSVIDFSFLAPAAAISNAAVSANIVQLPKPI